MSKQDYSDKIVDLLEGIVTRTNEMNRDPDSERCLELDLIMEDIRLLYRYYGMWKKDCEAGHQPVTAIPAAPVSDVPSFFTESTEPVPPVTPEPPTDTDTDLDSRQEQGPPSEANHHPEPEVIPEPAPKKEEERLPQPPANPAPGNKTGNGKTVIDLFSESQTKSVKDSLSEDDNSVHQRIASQKEDKSIGTRLQQQPIGHIKEAIGLNEKFLFINELFNGDIQAYNEAIANLNDMGDLTSAFDYLNKLTKDQGWDAGRSAETIEKLASFVQRRYM